MSSRHIERVVTDRDYFKGWSFGKALAAADKYSTPPDKISPVEIIEWALTEGEWYTSEDQTGHTLWCGPSGANLMPGNKKEAFYELKDALPVMHEGYISWWKMAASYLEFIEAREKMMRDSIIRGFKAWQEKESKKDPKEDPKEEPDIEGWIDGLELDDEPDEDEDV